METRFIIEGIKSFINNKKKRKGNINGKRTRRNN